MLVRPELTYIDKATKAAARVFPTGSSWLNFESRLPATEVFRDAVMDPAIGIDGPLALQTFATCEWQNWTSSIQIATFELATRIGLPPLEVLELSDAARRWRQVPGGEQSLVGLVTAPGWSPQQDLFALRQDP